MKQWIPVALTLWAGLVLFGTSGCEDNKPTYSEDEVRCSQQTIEGDTYCITETGYLRCPEEFPFLIRFENAAVCSTREMLDDEELAALVALFGAQILDAEPDPSEPSAEPEPEDVCEVSCTDSEERCNLSGERIERCVVDEESCPRWVADVSCSDGWMCDDTGGVVECLAPTPEAMPEPDPEPSMEVERCEEVCLRVIACPILASSCEASDCERACQNEVIRDTFLTFSEQTCDDLTDDALVGLQNSGVCQGEEREENCADGMDNDNDGATDCDDADCAQDEVCPATSCDNVFCEECYICVEGECVPDEAQRAIDAPVCGTLCGDWANRCSAILAFHEPLREGICFEPDDAQLCESTGGSWQAGLCSPRTCQEDEDLSCEFNCDFSCNCDEWSVWDEALGCVPSPGCQSETDNCPEDTICAGAWLADDGCFGPNGQALDSACCLGGSCTEPGFAFDPRTGACTAQAVGDGCRSPGTFACEENDLPCDVGLFIRYTDNIGSGDCEGSGIANSYGFTRFQAYAVNFTGEDIVLNSTERCPDDQAIFRGLPEGFDYYDTCADGICEDTGQPVALTIPANGELHLGTTVPLRFVGENPNNECSGLIPAGSYEIRYDLLANNSDTARVCNFSWLKLDVIE